jgi:hypothetical protein
MRGKGLIRIGTDWKRNALFLGVLLTLSLPFATAASAAPRVPNIKVGALRVERTMPDANANPQQAGAHPNTKLVFEFCDQGVPILEATNTAPIRITTATPVNSQAGGPSYVRGAQGNTAANGGWVVSPVGEPVNGAFTQFDLVGTDGTQSGNYVSGSARLRYTTPDIPDRLNRGCTQNQAAATVKDFTLHLPPGLLGNPTALRSCPMPLWQAAACPPDSIVGHSISSVFQTAGAHPFAALPVASKIFNIDTLGLEPARLGTGAFPSDPSGPFPVTVDIRTSGDRGINSTLINIPRNLGGFGGTPFEIVTALCGRVPTCTEVPTTNPDLSLMSATHNPNAETRPFFTNPTSCGTKTVALTARSWRTPEAPLGDLTVQPDGTDPPLLDSTNSDELTTTGCENVPFDLDFDVDPSSPENGGTTDAGKPSAQDVTLDYPREATCPAASVEPDCWYENEDIWQAQLKDITQSLPKGLRLSRGRCRPPGSRDSPTPTTSTASPVTARRSGLSPISTRVRPATRARSAAARSSGRNRTGTPGATRLTSPTTSRSDHPSPARIRLTTTVTGASGPVSTSSRRPRASLVRPTGSAAATTTIASARSSAATVRADDNVSPFQAPPERLLWIMISVRT